MPSSCTCPRLYLCVLRRNGSNALSQTHTDTLTFPSITVLPDSLFPALQTSRRRLARHCCLTCTHTDTESADLPAAATVFPAFEKMTRALCICAERCKLANCSRYTWKYSAHLGGAPIQDGGADFSRVVSDRTISLALTPMQTPPVSCDLN